MWIESVPEDSTGMDWDDLPFDAISILTPDVFLAAGNATKESSLADVVPSISLVNPASLLSRPPKNGNWDQRDLSSRIRIGYGRALSSRGIEVGATFRSPKTMGGFEGSCQYWKAGTL